MVIVRDFQTVVTTDAGDNILLLPAAHLVRPLRIGDQTPAHRHKVRFAFRNKLFGHFRLCNGSNNDNRNIHPILNRGGKMNIGPSRLKDIFFPFGLYAPFLDIYSVLKNLIF